MRIKNQLAIWNNSENPVADQDDEASEILAGFPFRVSVVAVGDAVVNGEICGGEEQFDGDFAGGYQGYPR